MDVADIPVVILAGGRGARFDHESQVLPKPLIEVAGRPILQHIIEGFVAQGFREFYVATGYLGERIREFYETFGHRFSWNFPEGKSHYWMGHPDDPYFVKCYDTGEDSQTGERVRRLRPFLRKRFVLTYGDGLSDVSMEYVVAQHIRTGALVTTTTVHPPGRFGVALYSWEDEADTMIYSFREKPDSGWINGGFMVMEPEIFDHLLDENVSLENSVLTRLAEFEMLHGYQHEGYWRCMDTRRDLEQIETDVKLANGILPWRKDMR